jgi:hypothetical protein
MRVLDIIGSMAGLARSHFSSGHQAVLGDRIRERRGEPGRDQVGITLMLAGLARSHRFHGHHEHIGDRFRDHGWAISAALPPRFRSSANFAE